MVWLEKAPRVWWVALAVVLAGCSNDLLRYRTKMWHQCEEHLAQTKQRVRTLKSERRDLRRRLSSTRRYLDACRKGRERLERKLVRLERELAAQRDLAERLEQERRKTARRVAFMRSLLERLRNMMEAGNLKVTLRKGRMILNLPTKVLFEPGRARLMERGKEALRKLAAVLKEIRDRDLVVAGHTDSQPIKHSRYKSNWELSVARAVAVVKFLQKEGVDPRHLSAAGFGEYDPVADNKTEEGRALNRRIEIIVMPKIDELPSWEGILGGEDAGSRGATSGGGGAGHEPTARPAAAAGVETPSGTAPTPRRGAGRPGPRDGAPSGPARPRAPREPSEGGLPRRKAPSN